jgi:hypothetical protein
MAVRMMMMFFRVLAPCRLVGRCIYRRNRPTFERCFDLMMEAVSTSETSVSFYETTQCNIPEDSHLDIREDPGKFRHRL